jgi:hypothetical protein
VNDHKAFFGIGLGSDGAKRTATGIGAISRKDIHMERPQAMRTVVAGGIAQRGNLLAAVDADKSRIVFGKSLGGEVCLRFLGSFPFIHVVQSLPR